jgi:DNA-binding transcriptional ArsR family regulator
VTDDELHVSTPEQFKALAHPTRHRLLYALDRPATISQLAVALDTRKGNVAHHLKVLVDGGLVAAGETRHVRGGTEVYYQRVSARVRMTAGEHSADQLPIAFHAVADEIADAKPDPFLTIRHLRLTAAQAIDLTATLTALAEELPSAGDDQPRFGLILGLYEQLDRQPKPSN